MAPLNQRLTALKVWSIGSLIETLNRSLNCKIHEGTLMQLKNLIIIASALGTYTNLHSMNEIEMGEASDGMEELEEALDGLITGNALEEPTPRVKTLNGYESHFSEKDVVVEIMTSQHMTDPEKLDSLQRVLQLENLSLMHSDRFVIDDAIMRLEDRISATQNQ